MVMRELPVQLPDDAAHERDGNKHGAQHESDGHDRAADFVHGFLCGLDRTQSVFDVVFDRLDDDDGVVNDDSDRQHDRQHRQAY